MAMAVTHIRRGAAAHADRPAVYFGDDMLTFREVDDRANLIAHHLLAAGVAKGAHVALLVNNGLDSIPMDFAAIKTGVVRVPLNARLSLDEHAAMLDGSRAGIVVADASLIDRAEELRARTPELTVLGLGVAASISWRRRRNRWVSRPSNSCRKTRRSCSTPPAPPALSRR